MSHWLLKKCFSAGGGELTLGAGWGVANGGGADDFLLSRPQRSGKLDDDSDGARAGASNFGASKNSRIRHVSPAAAGVAAHRSDHRSARFLREFFRAAELADADCNVRRRRATAH